MPKDTTTSATVAALRHALLADHTDPLDDTVPDSIEQASDLLERLEVAADHLEANQAETPSFLVREALLLIGRSAAAISQDARAALVVREAA